MRLDLLVPPALVTVDEGGVGLPALHLATRGDRCYVQVNRAAGCNHLRWVSSAEVGPATDLPPTTAATAPAATSPTTDPGPGRSRPPAPGRPRAAR